MLLPTDPELLAGPDLVLRRFRDDDLDGVIEQSRDPLTVAWTTVPEPYGRADGEQFLDLTRAGWESGDAAYLAIEFEGRYAGTVDLRFRELGWAETGYALHPAARGRRVMTRALRRALDWGFDDLGLAGVRWTAFAGNVASRRTAEACGFRIEGTMRQAGVRRGVRCDEWPASLLPHERPATP